jgi:hypothetical protein
VAISGSTVVVGAPYDDTGATNAGTGYVFDATTGTLLSTLVNPTPAASDSFGSSVAIWDNAVVVGAYADDTGETDAGAAYVFDATTGTLLSTLANPTPFAGDSFANTVAIGDSTAVIGAPNEDAVNTDRGAAYLFDTKSASASLDADGNGTADALSDGILILRYLFDPTGAWNVNDAMGSGAIRTTRDSISTFLDGGKSTALDADGNGTADALSDGILILRYLFDSEGAWNVNDALGSGATRTTRAAIKAYLDGFNPSPSPAPPMMAAATAPAEDPSSRSQAVPTDSPSLTVDTTVQVNSSVEPVSGADANRVRAAISQSLVVGDTSTVTFADAAPRSPGEGGQPEGLQAVDTALESWNRPTPCDVAVGWVPNRAPLAGATPGNEGPADQLWGEDDGDWFLPDSEDVIAHQFRGRLPGPAFRAHIRDSRVVVGR